MSWVILLFLEGILKELFQRVLDPAIWHRINTTVEQKLSIAFKGTKIITISNNGDSLEL